MKNISTVKKIIAFLLAAVMLFLTSCADNRDGEEPSTAEGEPVSVYGDTTETVKKSETVYVNMNPDGSQRSIVVSDWLHADRGRVHISDLTTLKDISVTKGHAAFQNNNGELIWQMDTSDVYYEGSSDSPLPVSVSIKYFLDGSEIAAKELAGKSGKFKMEVTMKNNIGKEVTIDGKKMTMYAPIAAIGGMILPYENFSDIEVSNGLSVGGGSYEVVVLAGAPGLNESLGLDELNISGFENFSFPDTFTVSATVTDFRLADTYYILAPLSALNLNVELPKTLEDVKSILNEVQNLQDILNAIDPNQLLAKFVTNGTSLKEMMDIMQKAITVYNENEALLKVMAQYLTPKNIETLSAFLQSLDGEQMQSVISLLSNVPALQSAVDSLMQLSTGLSDVMPILEGFSQALKDPEVAAALENLPETLNTLSEMTSFLEENKDVLNVLTQLMSSSDMQKFTDALDNLIEGQDVQFGDTDVSQLAGDAKALVLKMDEWLKFDYGLYTAAPDYMETGCMFICKTDPINLQ